MVYLDYNATTPIDKRVLLSINESLVNAWANPSSNSKAGIAAQEAIKTARDYLSEMIGANHANEIIFTSGGTESNNLVIHTTIVNFKKEDYRENGKMIRVAHIITSNVEHDSILKPLQHFQQLDQIELSVIPVSKVTGRIEAEDITAEIKPNTRLVTIMLANNETGIIQPIEQIGQTLMSLNKMRSQNSLPKILFHTDAAQAIGKLPLNVQDLNVDYLTIVGHKFYGPRIGALYVKNLDKGGKDVPLRPMIFGGGQERNFRPGTENTAMIAGLGMAAKLIVENLDEYRDSMAKVRDYLETRLKEVFGDNVVFNSVRGGVERLPNTTNVAFKNSELTGRQILSKTKNLEASVGAACHGHTSKPSHILLASGVEYKLANTSLRLSVGRETTKEDINGVISSLKEAINI